MRPHGSAEALEERRKEAVRRLRAGKSVAEVAASLGVSDRSVRGWRQSAADGGLRALKAKPQHVPTCRMSDQQKRELKKILLKGALAAGYLTDLWTSARVAETIHHQFEIEYHPDHVGRLLHDMDYSCQKPARQARERDDAAAEEFRNTTWTRIKRGRKKTS